jgi:hypothetical protein
MQLKVWREVSLIIPLLGTRKTFGKSERADSTRNFLKLQARIFALFFLGASLDSLSFSSEQI